MHIKEIILEGFKSYSGRTIIKGFDTQFNAITGLNGSGKSNILDAILFVLGLSKNLEILRVQKIQELIYKSGHAGITKAEVTIYFNNRDKNSNNCPPGYENCDEIIVTRQIQDDKSKYFVNGSIQTVKKVKDMFRNIQLNIETPHFFVGQGRITKIINLNQQELISMLEETAGTSLYNKKKSDCVQLMQKKEDKIKEINELINQEITPQLDKLQKDRDQYFVWKSGEQELQRMLKLLKSFEYYDRFSKCKDSTRLLEQTQIVEQEKSNEKRETTRQIKIIQEEIEKNQQKYSQENNKQLEKITKKLNEIKKEQTIKQSEIKNRKKQIDEGEKDIENFIKQVQQHKINLERLESKLDFEKQDLQSREAVYQSKKEQQDEAKRNAESQKQGNNSIENIKDQLNEQLQVAKKNKNAATGEIQKIKMKITKTQQELAIVDESIVSQNNQGSNKINEIKILEKETESLENEINNSNFNENNFNQVRDQLRNMENDMMQATHKLQDFYRQQGNYIFKLDYKDPEPNFDRSKVKGKLFSLFTVRDEQFTKALEIGAGNKLNQIVIENEKVGQILFKKNCFNYAVTFIPLNKIMAKEISANILQSAKQIANECKGNILNPVDAIEFKREVQPAIQYTFGSFLICSSNEIAKRIAYNQNQQLRIKCVTIDGDIFDPSGTLTGGFTNNNTMILFKVKQLNDINREIADINVKTKNIKDQFDMMVKENEYLTGIRQDLETKRYKLDKLQKDQKRPAGMNLQEKQQIYNDQLKDFKENLQKMIQQESLYQEETQNITNEMKNLEGSDIANIKDLWSNKVKKIGQEIQNQEKQIHQIRDSINNIEQEKENSSKEIQKMQSKVQSLEGDIEKNNNLIQQQQKELEKINMQYNIDKKEKDELERQINAVDHKLKELDTQKTSLQADLEALDEELKKIQQKQQKYTFEIKSYTEKINELKKDFPFINQEKDLFGVQGSEYDYTNFDFEDYVKTYDLKKNENEKMQKKVNFKVEANIEHMENKFKELIKNKQEVENDKTEIVNNMKELDIKKQETLEKCYLCVSQHFGRIFSDLLKGAQAKICKVEGKDISEGIELSVKFGGKWKNSLTELSGGQRSLLALSFVLALLLYKPAPFYILDEVDAALDLSHTENIGHMISNNFPQSQFIIISHKDGMYQNANVLFKTSVVDGNSQVERYDFKNKRKDKNIQQA